MHVSIYSSRSYYIRTNISMMYLFNILFNSIGLTLTLTLQLRLGFFPHYDLTAALTELSKVVE